LRTGAVSGRTPPLAEVGTNILEFGVLSNVTGDRKYFNAAKKAYQATIDRRSSLNLLGTTIDVNGNWRDGTDTAPNPPVDSFYEYLWGGFALLGDQDLRNWYNMLVGAINNRMIDRVHGRQRRHHEPDAQGRLHAGVLVRGEHEVPVPDLRQRTAVRLQHRAPVDRGEDPARSPLTGWTGAPRADTLSVDRCSARRPDG